MNVGSLLLCCLSLLSTVLFSYDAYIVVPVADLVGEPLDSLNDYKHIPFSGDPLLCKRIHQALYHERVHVIQTRDEQVQVELPTVFYKPPTTKMASSTFWTSKKYLLPVDNIQGHQEKLPQSIAYTSWKITQVNPLQITLIKPYHDPKSSMTFSAGTRFIRTDSEVRTGRFTVYFLNPKTYQIETTAIPAQLCIATDTYTASERIDLFINLIRSWITAGNTKSFIPYVWGGTSIVQYTKKRGILRQKQISTKKAAIWYERLDNNDIIKTGCDCSGLILRAAQIYAIPYFFKNSYTATCYLKTIGVDESIQKGDIVWVPGHLMIVADLKQNTLFEQRSYDHGYGKLHEIPLRKVFKDIKTWQDLLTAYHKQLPLHRIDNTGTVRDTFKTFKILSLASAWHTT